MPHDDDEAHNIHIDIHNRNITSKLSLVFSYTYSYKMILIVSTRSYYCSYELKVNESNFKFKL